MKIKWRIQDFPEVGRQHSGVTHTILPKFPPPKLHKNMDAGEGAGGIPRAHLRSTNETHSYVRFIHYQSQLTNVLVHRK